MRVHNIGYFLGIRAHVNFIKRLGKLSSFHGVYYKWKGVNH